MPDKNAPIETKNDLIDYIASGEKKLENWGIGTEHEKFLYDVQNFKRLPYFGDVSVSKLLSELQIITGWMPYYEGENIIALKGDAGDSITLEPGGQFELSGGLLKNIHETCSEVNTHLKHVRDVCKNIGAIAVGMGFDPLSSRDDITWMPKGRYKIMRDYMPTVGNLGIDMMIRTSTVQVNLDYKNEQDMINKMRVSVALQPVATALFASSPFIEGKDSGYLSYRSHCWSDTDNDRCGMLPFIFDDDFGYEKWVDYVLDVPMYFFESNGAYENVAGQSFHDFMQGKLPNHKGRLPTMKDWEDHMTTVFPEVRLKKFIEMRGADGGPWRNLCALSAIWVGLLYDDDALKQAMDLIKNWNIDEMSTMRMTVPKMALKTPFRDETVQDIAKKMLEISHGGLKRRSCKNKLGEDETGFLQPVMQIADEGVTIAEKLRDAIKKGDYKNMQDLLVKNAY
jgi:glutamate--cysteine ligase